MLFRGISGLARQPTKVRRNARIILPLVFASFSCKDFFKFLASCFFFSLDEYSPSPETQAQVKMLMT